MGMFPEKDFRKEVFLTILSENEVANATPPRVRILQARFLSSLMRMLNWFWVL
jgi:hypothetical protein